MLAAGVGILAVPSIPMFTLVYLGTCTHCNLPNNQISEFLSHWSLFLDEQTGPQSFIPSSFSTLLIPPCVGLNAVIILHLAPCWRKTGSIYASSPLQSDSCSWQVYVEEIPWVLQEKLGLHSLPVAKDPEATPG